MKDIFKRGKLTLPFLVDAKETISNYPDSDLPVHAITIKLLKDTFIPKVEEFIKCERRYTNVTNLAIVINLWCLLGITFNLISAGFMWWLSVVLLAVVNTDIIVQYLRLFNAKRNMKRICARYTQYMAMREHTKEAVDNFIGSLDNFIDALPDNNKKEESSNGSDE